MCACLASSNVAGRMPSVNKASSRKGIEGDNFVRKIIRMLRELGVPLEHADGRVNRWRSHGHAHLLVFAPTLTAVQEESET